jgi:hypothetical protein
MDASLRWHDAMGAGRTRHVAALAECTGALRIK